MMIKAAFNGAAHGTARGFAWGCVLTATIAVLLGYVFSP